MANHRIWTPDRFNYVKDASKDIEEECIFCAKAAEDDDEANLIVHRGEGCFVILNLYPYINGHLMVAPYAHISRLQELPAEAATEMILLAQRAMGRIESVYEPHGFNVGMNQGRVAGAGIEHHIEPPRVSRRACLRVETDAGGPAEGVTALAQNSDPFTYFASRPVRVCEGVEIDDGTISVGVLERAVQRDMPSLIPRLFSAERPAARHRRIEHYAGVTAATVTSTSTDANGDLRSFPVQVDGDYIGERDAVELGVAPGALTVIS